LLIGHSGNSFDRAGFASATCGIGLHRRGQRPGPTGHHNKKRTLETQALKNLKQLAVAAAFACAIGGFGSSSSAEPWPTRTITIVTSFAAGSVTDTTARIIAQVLQEQLGRTVIVENKAGAGGLIAAQTVARADPDGYTLLLTTNSTHSAAQALYKKVPYDPIKDFTPIARIASFPSVVVVNPEIKIKTIQELVAYAKANPGKLSYGHGNSTGYVVGEAIKHQANIDIVRVAYRSTPPAVTDLIAGHIPMMIVDISTALPQLSDKTMLPLAVFTKTRSSILPDVPTLDETVIPGFDLLAWVGLFGPANLPPDVVQTLAKVLKVALANPEILEKFKSSGIEPYWGDTDEFKAYVASELVKWTSVIKAAGIEPE
jgi:tripartite-type tricarboxylate transporter receptor subunit TctC